MSIFLKIASQGKTHWMVIMKGISCRLVAERSARQWIKSLGKAESDTFSPSRPSTIALHSLQKMYRRPLQRKCKRTSIQEISNWVLNLRNLQISMFVYSGSNRTVSTRSSLWKRGGRWWAPSINIIGRPLPATSQTHKFFQAEPTETNLETKKPTRNWP